MLRSVPCLNTDVQWQVQDSGEWMAVFKRHLTWPQRVYTLLFPSPDIARVMLDAVGSGVVRQIDGKRTVGELIALVADEFNLSRKEAEVALLQYLEDLGKRRLVGFLQPPKTGSKE